MELKIPPVRERRYIETSLEPNEGRVTAPTRLGINRKSLRERMKRLGICWGGKTYPPDMQDAACSHRLGPDQGIVGAVGRVSVKSEDSIFRRT